MPLRQRLSLGTVMAGLLLWVIPAAAQTPSEHPPLPTAPSEKQSRPSGQTGTGAPPPAPAPAAPTGLWERANLFGDIGGLRPLLGNYGISIGLTETSEVLGNVTGGVRTGFDYDGLTELSLGIDTSKAFGWEGGTFNISGLQIHGRNLSTDNLFTLQTASGIEANRTTRLWELWYQQAFLGGKFDVKVGLQSIDQEFITSQGSSLFINTVMGWPAVPSLDLYAGGPAYPLSSLGIRLRTHPSDAITVLGGVFQDNPPGGPFNSVNSQLLGSTRWGGNFNLRTGALFVAEIQYAVNPPPSEPPPAGAPPPGLPGLYKFGFWYDTAPFPDQRFDTAGLSLANPASTGVPLQRQHNFSLYGVVDQVIWHPHPEGARALGVFARIMGAPGDRNLANFSVNAGVTLKAPLPGRANDTFGVGFGIVKIGGNAVGLSKDVGFFTQAPFPVRSKETFIEATYQAQIAPWWIVQPDLQYVFNPSGGIPNPLGAPAQRIGNELVLGLRTSITF
jgi:porin